MTTWSMPWANTSPGDAGPYSDAQWAEMHKILFRADENKRGVLVSDQNASLKVSQKSGGADMSVDVSAGAAMIAGRVFNSNAVTNLAIAAADPTLARIDLVVLRADSSGQTITLAVKTGTAAASPAVPSLDVTGSPYFEIPIARIAVAAAASSITDANITDARSAANVPQRTYITVTNGSGGELLPGEVVVWSDAATNTVTTTTTQDDYMVAGVVTDVIAPAGTGRLCVIGLHPVNVSGAVAVGNALVTSATAKKAIHTGSNGFGRVLQATAGAGQTLALLNVKPVYPAFDQKFMRLSKSATPTALTDIDATNLGITLVTHGGPVDLFLRCSFYQNNGIILDFAVDGVNLATREGLSTPGAGIFTPVTAASSQVEATLGVRVENLAPGSHTFTVQWGTGTGTTVSIASCGLVFSAREVLN